MSKKNKKKIVFKTSLLDSRKKGMAKFRFNENGVENKEILASFGGLKLLYMCSSVSPRMGKIREELFPGVSGKSKVSEIKSPKRKGIERLPDIKAVKSESKFLFYDKSDSKIINSEENDSNFMGYEEKSTNFVGLNNSKSFYNTSKINFDCSILPLPKSENLESIFTYIHYKPTLRNPFKY